MCFRCIHKVLGIALVALVVAIACTRAWPQDLPKPQQVQHRGIFGSLAFRSGSLKALPQWVRVLKKIKAERHIYQVCDKDVRKCPFPAVAAWRAMERSVKGLKPLEQLREVNDFINKWPYRTDRENYGVEDYWASPLQFLRRSGDCEDYAIIKYVTLRQLGFPASKLRIVVVRDTLRGVPHAILAVYLKHTILVMDSLFDAILPDTQITFYFPEYAVNETAKWAYVMPIAPKLATDRGAGVQ